MKKVALHNLGCKVNAYETDIMRKKLQECGYKIVPFEETADIYIVNTCTVTNIADRKSRQMLHRAKQKNPSALVVAAGCYVQTGLESLKKDCCVDLAVGNDKKGNIAEILEAYFASQNKPERVAEHSEHIAGSPEHVAVPSAYDEHSACGGFPDKTLNGTTVTDISKSREYAEMKLGGTLGHTRAYIKIQDGCNQFCSYCAIPLARGRVRSRRAEDVLQEIRGLAGEGYREVVLTGIHISSYGTDRGEKDSLIDLIRRINVIDGIERIRLGSMEPRLITEEFAYALADLPKVCPHFHLSLQSGCDDTLKRMNRHYTTGEYCKSVEILRGAFDFPAVTTDVIVGFPGETDEEFKRTYDFIEKTGFYELHVFKYSRRDGTAAAKMPCQVSEETKSLRSGALLELERRQSREFRGRYIGREAEILLEEKKNIRGRDYVIGHTRDYVKIAVPPVGVGVGPNAVITALATGFITDEILSGETVCVE